MRLFNPCTLTIDTAARVAEAHNLISALCPEFECVRIRDKRSADFIEDMAGRLAVSDPVDSVVTEKQLSWLQNLYDRYVERA